MSLTTKTLANYLGNDISLILADLPFKNWTFNKSYENDLEEPRIDYIFPQNGMDLICDADDRLTTIFLYADETRCFKEDLLDLPFSLTRKQVIECLGPPSKSGGPINDPVLGECGSWDRFARSEYSIHVEFRVDADRIKMVTLMRADVVP
jgi:hypothetical protein